MDIILYIGIILAFLAISIVLLFTFPIQKSFNEIYNIRRGGRKGIRFLLMAIYATIFECFLLLIKRMIQLPNGKLLDGYLLTLLGPFILIWWIIWALIGCMIVSILIILWIPILTYTFLFELPASFLNAPKEIYLGDTTNEQDAEELGKK
jgi:uncharacterized BrkB/YihY/UPF0761 family membrane protein